METKPTPPKKLTPPNTAHLEALAETLETARQEVIDLCESLADHSMLEGDCFIQITRLEAARTKACQYSIAIL